MITQDVIQWFDNHNISSCVIYNENNVNVIVAATKNPAVVSEMISDISTILQKSGLHLSTKRIRGGTAISIGIEALNENAFNKILTSNNIQLEVLDFDKKLEESLIYKSSFTPTIIKPLLPTRMASIALNEQADSRNIFNKFGKAIDVLSRNLSVNIKELLNRQGIKWDMSKDNTSIILYVLNAQTKAPQPMARISADTLQSPNDFQKQLLSIVDFAKGQAPGTEEQKKQELQNQDKTIRDVANAAVPPDQNAVSQQMGVQ